MNKSAVLGVGALGLLVSACIACHPSSFLSAPPTLVGTEWALTEIRDTVVIVAPDQTWPVISLQSSGNMGGTTGCNRMFGSYSTKGTNLEFSGIGTTKMYCPSAMELEAKMLEVLSQTTHFGIDADALDLFDNASVRLARFRATKPE